MKQFVFLCMIIAISNSSFASETYKDNSYVPKLYIPGEKKSEAYAPYNGSASGDGVREEETKEQKRAETLAQEERDNRRQNEFKRRAAVRKRAAERKRLAEIEASEKEKRVPASE